jgi:segregation and condensation protein A
MVPSTLTSTHETVPSSGYQVKLPLFEGPLDLLLFLIHRDQIDIHDIPIARITEEYLGYLQMMRVLQLDVAAEFMVMAATLMSIKSQMLLPRPEIAGQFAEEDPRQELVQRLLEYRLYKTAAQSLLTCEQHARQIFTRPGESLPDETEEEEDLLEVSLFELITAFEQLIDAQPEKAIHQIVLEEYTVKQRCDYILDLLQSEKKIAFRELIRSDTRTTVMVVTFLALLELMRVHHVAVRQRQAFGEIWIYRRAVSPETTSP